MDCFMISNKEPPLLILASFLLPPTDILIEGHNGLNNKFDQLNNKIDRKIEDRQATDTVLLKEIRELRTDLNEH